jgi:heme oxygenase
MPPPSPEPLLAALRQATGQRHARIEALLRLDAPMPLSRYRAILRGFHEFLACWEAAVQAALPERLQAWFDARRRGAFAARDVAWLEAPPSAPLAERARRAVAGLPLAGVATLFGSMYVIEGSALGGRVIAPGLARELGLGPGRGASYFHGYGEHTGAMWREFRQRAASEVGGDAEAVRAACRGAERTFDALLHTFALLDSFAPIAA